MAKSGADTSTIRNYIKKANFYYSINIDTSIFYSRQALMNVSNINDSVLACKVYETHAKSFYYKNRYDSAEYFYKMAIKIVPKDSLYYLSNLYNSYSSALIMVNKYDTALYYIIKSFEINKKLGLKKKLMYNYANFQGVYRCLGAFDISTSYIFKGLPIAEEYKDTVMMIKFLQALGNNYSFINSWDLSIFYSKKALDYSLVLNDYLLASELANTIALAYGNNGNKTEGVKYLHLSYDYAHEINYSAMEAMSLVNLASFLVSDNQYDSALYYNAKSDSIARSINYISGITATDIIYGQIYLETKKYDLALKYLLHAANSKEHGEISLINRAYYYLSTLYEDKNDFKNAYKYYKIYSQNNDSLINEQKAEEIANLKMQYELNKKQELMDAITSQKEAEMQAEKMRYKFIKNITIIGAVAFAIITILLVISYRGMQKQKITNLKNEINSYRQRLMAQQMNPHFIFNMLNSIQFFIYENKKEESMNFVSQFAQLMRLNLYNSQNDIITIKDEIDALKIYLELEKIRLVNKFDYSIEIDPMIDIEKQLVPSFLIQPLVENSIKHGISSIEHKGFIQTKIALNDSSLVYYIMDNGIGFKRSKAKKNDNKHNSYGLELTKKRIFLIGILNNKQTGFTFTDIYDENEECIGSKVELIIPASLQLI
ncbi:MAG: histidine kinase [Bacteroidales bacterium]|nr:histidine kinase [Bacteroidales bacterium]